MRCLWPGSRQLCAAVCPHHSGTHLLSLCSRTKAAKWQSILRYSLYSPRSDHRNVVAIRGTTWKHLQPPPIRNTLCKTSRRPVLQGYAATKYSHSSQVTDAVHDGGDKSWNNLGKKQRPSTAAVHMGQASSGGGSPRSGPKTSRVAVPQPFSRGIYENRAIPPTAATQGNAACPPTTRNLLSHHSPIGKHQLSLQMMLLVRQKMQQI